MNNNQLYKGKPISFANVVKKREAESRKIRYQRHDKRATLFNSRRNLSLSEDSKSEENSRLATKTPEKKIKILDRKLALQKYKAEKEASKNATKQKKRPPFIVGIPHHGFSPFRDLSNVQHSDKHEVRSKRITRAATKTEKTGKIREVPVRQTQDKKRGNINKNSPVKQFPFLGKKTVFTFKHPQMASAKKLTSPHTPTVLKRSAKKIPMDKCLLNVDLKKKETESHVPLEVLAKPLGNALPPIQIDVKEEVSPVHSLGISQRNLTDQTQIPCASTDITNQSMFQRGRLDEESHRLLELADKWGALALQEMLPTEIADEIDSVVGQTRLLTRDKFNQFRGLIDQFEYRDGSHVVTFEDLNGFWDMMYLQVETLTKKYNNLESLRNNHWVEPKPKKKKRNVNKINKVIPSGCNKADKSVTAVNEDLNVVQTPIKDKRFSSSNVLSNRRHTRSFSPAPYIAMRLSSIGRSSFRSPANIKVESSILITPKNLLRVKNETAASTEGSSVEATVKVEGFLISPRRSQRLKERISTPHNCLSCEIPNSHEQTRKKKDNTIEKSKSSKRFTLKPSKLIINSPGSINQGTTSNKQMRKQKETVGGLLLDSADGFEEQDPVVRRSSRLTSAKKVTFNSNTAETSSINLPRTPYIKRGSRSIASPNSPLS